MLITATIAAAITAICLLSGIVLGRAHLFALLEETSFSVSTDWTASIACSFAAAAAVIVMMFIGVLLIAAANEPPGACLPRPK